MGDMTKAWGKFIKDDAEIRRVCDELKENHGAYFKDDKGNKLNLMDWQAMLQTEVGTLRLRNNSLNTKLTTQEEELKALRGFVAELKGDMNQFISADRHVNDLLTKHGLESDE